MAGEYVLVVGPADVTGEVIGALRARGISAWADRLGRAAADGISLDWADALIVIDPTDHIESRHVRPLVEFRGPSILATEAPLKQGDVARLLDAGFDSVIRWPSTPDLLAAMAGRMLGFVASDVASPAASR